MTMLELWRFLRVRKKFWLLPIIIILLLFTPLLIFGGGPARWVDYFYPLGFKDQEFGGHLAKK